MNSGYSGKKCIKIVLIQGRNAYDLFREEMNSAYLGKKEYCLFKEEMSNLYSAKTWIVPIQEINE